MVSKLEPTWRYIPGKGYVEVDTSLSLYEYM